MWRRVFAWRPLRRSGLSRMWSSRGSVFGLSLLGSRPPRPITHALPVSSLTAVATSSQPHNVPLGCTRSFWVFLPAQPSTAATSPGWASKGLQGRVRNRSFLCLSRCSRGGHLGSAVGREAVPHTGDLRCARD
ncbi:hypothetical protein F4780DRAFT_380496 [Xylariomycetidae sp. FL0641]|nr:hypothetical protein F4780DRAFT_380496 [Xylariomycetidae sp. FL0641]